MEKVEEYIKKLVKKADDPYAYYTWGKEYRSNIDRPLFFVTIVWSVNGLTNFQLKENTQAELLETLKKQYRNMKSTTLAIQYFQRQIEFNQESINYSNRMIKSIEENDEKKSKKKLKK